MMFNLLLKYFIHTAIHEFFFANTLGVWPRGLFVVRKGPVQMGLILKL